VGPRNHVFGGGGEISHGNGQFSAVIRPTENLKSTGSPCCGVRSKRDHLIVNNGMTCDAAFCRNFLTACFHTLADDDCNHYPRESEEYVFTGVSLCVCVFVCDHDNYLKELWTVLHQILYKGS